VNAIWKTNRRRESTEGSLVDNSVMRYARHIVTNNTQAKVRRVETNISNKKPRKFITSANVMETSILAFFLVKKSIWIPFAKRKALLCKQ